MALLDDIIEKIELHSVTGIRHCFESGVDPNAMHRDEPLIYELTSEYTRSPDFRHCIRIFIEFGVVFRESELLAVLADDPVALSTELAKDPSIVQKSYSLRCAYTPLHEVTLLHVCAEFNHGACAEVLVNAGADVNAIAGVDENGFGKQTPIFHTVNQNNDQSADMLDFLLTHGADLSITIPGLIWGKGYDWETLIPSINPISYAMMGNLPQMHRSEETISKIVSRLLQLQYGIRYQSKNVPNKYLH